jgi:GNAT superfamily N-acetyltransferase
MAIVVETLSGDALALALDDLARLRIAVFREWPYLYEGTLDYEQGYLRRFAGAEGGVIVAARDGARIVGAATAAPLLSHTPAFAPLFAERGLAPERIFYFGESVLLASHRGQGLGHAFFDHREAAARKARGPEGPFSHTAFCSVLRPDGHPLSPQDYRPLDAFWEKRGYRKIAGLIGSYDWRDIGEAAERPHPMQFWMRPL